MNDRAPVVIRRGMATVNPSELQGLLYPLYAGVRSYAQDQGLDTKRGTWALSLAWTEDEK